MHVEETEFRGTVDSDEVSFFEASSLVFYIGLFWVVSFGAYAIYQKKNGLPLLPTLAANVVASSAIGTGAGTSGGAKFSALHSTSKPGRNVAGGMNSKQSTSSSSLLISKSTLEMTALVNTNRAMPLSDRRSAVLPQAATSGAGGSHQSLVPTDRNVSSMNAMPSVTQHAAHPVMAVGSHSDGEMDGDGWIDEDDGGDGWGEDDAWNDDDDAGDGDWANGDGDGDGEGDGGDKGADSSISVAAIRASLHQEAAALLSAQRRGTAADSGASIGRQDTTTTSAAAENNIGITVAAGALRRTPSNDRLSPSIAQPKEPSEKDIFEEFGMTPVITAPKTIKRAD